MAEIEYETKILDIDGNLQLAIEQLTAEGWEMIPHIRSFAVFNVQRVKDRKTFGGFGHLHVDESKVHIIRNGKIVEG